MALPFTAPQNIKTAFIGRGLYRLYQLNDGKYECVYVGQSRCISGRIHFHFAEGLKKFDYFDYLLISESVSPVDLTEMEADEIFRLQPLYNLTIPPTGKHKRINLIANLLKVKTRKLQDLVKQKNVNSFCGKYDYRQIVELYNESQL
jgi:hypothetical protein